MRRTTARAGLTITAWGTTALLLATLGAPATAADDPRDQSSASVAQASPALPGDADRGRWSFGVGAQGPELSWRSPVRLPLTDARVEVRVDGAVVGHPTIGPDGRTLTLPAEGIDTTRAQVWLSGERLDVRAATGPAARPGPAVEPAVGPTRRLAADPALPGDHVTRTFDYSEEGLHWSEYDGDLEVEGHVVLPVETGTGVPVTDAPLVVFLHGRHQACYGRGDDGTWPCAGRSKPVPSHLGYDYLQRMLASQGYATVSVAANGINQQDWHSPDGGASARSALVRHHLELIAGWAADTGNADWYDRVDTEQTVLVGHSRGGEGVDQAAIETLRGAPYRLVGQLLIAPTDFGYQTAGYLPTVTLLPYCDGDVYDLQGQRFVEAAAGLSAGDPSLRASVLLRGANHNFFNTEWTPGISQAPSFDDWGQDEHPICGSAVSRTRLSAAEQRRAARTLVAASVGAFVTGDQADVDVVDSRLPVRIPAAGNAVAWTHAIGGNRTRVAVGAGATVRGDARSCAAVLRDGPRAGDCSPTGGYPRALHWTPATGGYASVFSAAAAGRLPRHLRLTWDEPGGVGGLALDAPLDLGGAGTTLDLRVVADPTAPTARFDVLLSDADGDTWRSSYLEVAPRPGGRNLVALHASTVRLDPSAASAGFDLSAVVAIDIEQVSDTGSLWVVDASARRTGLAPVPDVQLPSIVLGRARVTEGNSGGRAIAEVPFTVRGDVTTPARFGVAVDQFSFGPRSRSLRQVVTVAPGQSAGVIEVPFRSDRRNGLPRAVQPLFGVGLQDVTMSTYGGRLTVIEDDPEPTRRFRVDGRQVRYGQAMQFVVTLSKPRSVDSWVRLRGVTTDGARELRVQDVQPRWLRRHVGEVPPGPVFRHLRYLGVLVAAGERRGVLTIPTRTLRRDQGQRALSLTMIGDGGVTRTVRVH